MVDVGVDEKALSHLLEKVLVADAHAPVTLALEKAGVRTASDLVSLKLDPYVPLKYDRAVEGGNKVEKNIPLLQAEMRQIIGIQEYIHSQYYSKNVSHKFFKSLDDWEELTAKNFISFRINIAPFLPPDVTPAVVTQPSPATSNLCDWEKGVKPDMSIFRELKNVKEWDQWDTQFRANVSTQGLSSVLDSNFRPQTFKDKVLFHEQQQYLYAVFVCILKTDEGKAIARKYKSTFDAQSIYRELQESAVKCSVYMSDLAINDGEDDALQFSVANEADFNIDSDPMTLMTRPNQPSNERELSKPATVVAWTRDSDWDPAIFNLEFGDNDDEWDDPVMDHRDLLDKVGNYRNHQGVDAGEVHSSRQIEVTISRLHFQARQVRPGEQDWETLCRLFGWAKHYKDAYGVS